MLINLQYLLLTLPTKSRNDQLCERTKHKIKYAKKKKKKNYADLPSDRCKCLPESRKIGTKTETARRERMNLLLHRRNRFIDDNYRGN